eukprot:1983694-Prorocentrum_lima.AAC.1
MSVAPAAPPDLALAAPADTTPMTSSSTVENPVDWDVWNLLSGMARGRAAAQQGMQGDVVLEVIDIQPNEVGWDFRRLVGPWIAHTHELT